MRIEEKLVTITGHHKTTHNTLELIGRFLICEGEMCAISERVRVIGGLDAYIRIVQDMKEIHSRAEQLVEKIDSIWFGVDRQLSRIVVDYEQLTQEWTSRLQHRDE
jgi:hypothetical protein